MAKIRLKAPCGTAAAALIAGLAAPTVAQTTTAAVGDSTGVEDIVVTAQKREERLQNVPIAITAISAAGALARGVNDTQALQDIVPGLTFTKLGSAALPFIRGVGSQPISQGDENSVVIYVDGVLQLSPNGAIFSLANIERVEVLKGPQGTLFGRNANGGVISVTTRTPGQETAAEAMLSYGNFQTVEGTAYLSTPLGENLATDLSFYGRNQGKGWGKNFVYGTEVFKGHEITLRNKWSWTPGDRTKITFGGGLVRSYLNGNAYHPAKGEVARDGKTVYRSMYDVDNNLRGSVKLRGWDANIQIRQDLDWAEFVSISSYSDLKSYRPVDSDGTAENFTSGVHVDQFDKGFTQEVQLQSPSSSVISWVLGGYYLDGKSGYIDPDAITVVGSDIGVPLLRIHGVAKTKSLAGFAQGTAELFPKFRLTLGGRYTTDKRSINNSIEIPIFGPDPIAADKDSKRFNRFTYKITADYRLNNAAMVYLTHSTGFKAGIFNIVSPGEAPVRPEKLKVIEAGLKLTLFDRKLQINSAAYYYDYKDIQGSVFSVESGGVNKLLNAGAAKVKGIDLDFTAAPVRNLTISGGFAYVHGKYTEFDEAPAFDRLAGGGREQTAIDADGNRMVRTPKIQWSLGGQYQIPVGDGFVKLNGNLSHQGSVYWDFANQFREGSRDMLSASLGWAPSENLEISIWGKNLLNEVYANDGLASAYAFLQRPGEPRTYGVRLRGKL